jgi:hypothetical protein
MVVVVAVMGEVVVVAGWCRRTVGVEVGVVVGTRGRSRVVVVAGGTLSRVVGVVAAGMVGVVVG